MRLASVIMRLGLRIGMTDSRSNRMVSFFLSISEPAESKAKPKLNTRIRRVGEVLKQRTLVLQNRNQARNINSGLQKRVWYYWDFDSLGSTKTPNMPLREKTARPHINFKKQINK